MTDEAKVDEIRKDVLDAMEKLEQMAPDEYTAGPAKRKTPYSRGQSPSLNQNNPREFTKPHTSFLADLSRAHVPYRAEKYVGVNKWFCRATTSGAHRAGSCRETFTGEMKPGTKCYAGHENWEQVQLKCDTLILVPDQGVGTCPEKYISIEAEGEAHEGEDPSERDRLLREQGILVWHADNKLLKEWGYKIAELLVLVTQV